MKFIFPGALALILISCDQSKNNIYQDPPISPDPNKIQFWGLKTTDESHRLYTVPVDTTPVEIVRTFEVGSHGAMSYNFDEKETVELVAKKVAAISEIIPFRILFADPAGLKMRFHTQITREELDQIEALFPEDEMMQAGLDGYISAWDGKSPILGEVLKTNTLHLWWD